MASDVFHIPVVKAGLFLHDASVAFTGQKLENVISLGREVVFDRHQTHLPTVEVKSVEDVKFAAFCIDRHVIDQRFAGDMKSIRCMTMPEFAYNITPTT